MLNKIAKYRLPYSYVAGICPIVYAFWKHPALFHPAIALVLLGITLRIWAAGHITKNSSLTRSGPYALTRNPLYLGSFLSAVGVFSLVQAWSLLAVFLPTFALFYGATILGEEKYLATVYGDDYATYCSQVGVFFPKPTLIRSSDDTSFSFSKAMLYNKEINAVACTTAEVLLVYLSGLSA